VNGYKKKMTNNELVGNKHKSCWVNKM